MTPAGIVDTMMARDFFSQWLGIKVFEVREGYCRLRMRITRDMLNGFGIAHGGITYSLADSALAFASNSKGIKSVSIETSIAHISALKENDEIVAEASCVTETAKLGHYEVKVYLENNPTRPAALFKGMVYKKKENW
jgi:acyl-CoA thioesterase